MVVLCLFFLFCAENAKDAPFGANTKENPTKNEGDNINTPQNKIPLTSERPDRELDDDLPPASGHVLSERAFCGRGDGTVGEGNIVHVRAVVLLSLGMGNGWGGYREMARG